MKKSNLRYLIIMLAIVGVSIGFTTSSLEEEKESEQDASLTSKEDNTQQVASEAFDKMMMVVTHKRCMNCHPADDQPRQGEESHLHRFGVQRGEDGHGTAALKCNTCHQEENNNYSGVPGAPHWHLAPKSMGWQGLDRIGIAQAMTDQSKNGGRSIDEVVRHLTEDPLVLWVFEPGVNQQGVPREKPPLSKEEYIAAVKQWAAEGAAIPEQ